MKSWVKSVFVVSYAVVLTVSSGLSGVARPGDGDTQLQVQVDELTAKIKANPKDAESIYGRAKLLRKLGKLDLSELDAKEVVKLRPSEPTGYWLLSMISKDRKDKESGLKFIRECIRREPLNLDHVHYEMSCLRSLKRYKELLGVASKLEQTNPDDAYIFFYRAYARDGLGQTKSLVRAELMKARELAKNDNALLVDINSALQEIR